MDGIDQINGQQIDGQQDDVHPDANSEEVGESEAAGTVDEHVGAGTDGGGIGSGDGNHKRDNERHGVASQGDGLVIDDGKENAAGSHIAGKFTDN